MVAANFPADLAVTSRDKHPSPPSSSCILGRRLDPRWVGRRSRPLSPARGKMLELWTSGGGASGKLREGGVGGPAAEPPSDSPPGRYQGKAREQRTEPRETRTGAAPRHTVADLSHTLGPGPGDCDLVGGLVDGSGRDGDRIGIGRRRDGSPPVKMDERLCVAASPIFTSRGVPVSWSCKSAKARS